MSGKLGFGLPFCISLFRLLEAACGLKVVVEDPLDLAVDAAEFIGCPLFQGLVGVFVDAQDK